MARYARRRKTSRGVSRSRSYAARPTYRRSASRVRRRRTYASSPRTLRIEIVGGTASGVARPDMIGLKAADPVATKPVF